MPDTTITSASWCAPLEFVALAQFEAVDAGVQRVEARLHLVRGVREADDELVLGRDHAVLTLLRLGAATIDGAAAGAGRLSPGGPSSAGSSC